MNLFVYRCVELNLKCANVAVFNEKQVVVGIVKAYGDLLTTTTQHDLQTMRNGFISQQNT